MSQEFFNFRKKELYEILKYSIENVEYYKSNIIVNLPSIEMFDYDYFLNNVPILEKKDLIRKSKKFISNEVEIEDLVFDVTSGTEGRPLICYKTKRERIRCSNQLWKARRNHISKLRSKDKFLRFYAYREIENELITNKVLYKNNDMLLPLFDFSEEKIKSYWDAVIDFKPIWVHGPSTAVFNIAKEVSKRGYNIPDIKMIELNGEFVLKEQKEYIEKCFNSTVVNHYGSREFWTIAFTCKCGELKILDDSVFVEAIYNNVINAKEIIVTSLKNKAWPLIRYKIGDLGEVKHKISCNSDKKNEFILTLNKGRKADYFSLGNGQIINAILFSGIVRGVTELKDEISVYQYQVQKIDDMSLRVLLCLGKTNDDSGNKYVDILDNEIRKTIKSEIRIIYQIVDEIKPDYKTGKCKDFLDLSSREGK